MTLRTMTLALAISAIVAWPAYVPQRVKDCVTGPRSYPLMTGTFAGRGCTRSDGTRWFAGYQAQKAIVRWTP
jgi:hypothetical protein